MHIQTQAAKIWNYGINWVDNVKKIELILTLKNYMKCFLLKLASCVQEKHIKNLAVTCFDGSFENM